MEIGERRIVAFWDDKTASERYRLEELVEEYDEISNEVFDYWSTIVCGDREWAEREAEHYGIGIQERMSESGLTKDVSMLY